MIPSLEDLSLKNKSNNCLTNIDNNQIKINNHLMSNFKIKHKIQILLTLKSSILIRF